MGRKKLNVKPDAQPVNVLITYRWHRLDEALIQRIRDVSPKINVIYSKDDLQDEEHLPSADILYCIWLPNNISNATRLKWIQLLSAGYNVLYGSPVENTNIAVTTTSGIHGTPIAEYVICSMIILSRRLNVVFKTENKDDLWKDFAFIGRDLRGMKVGLIGMGIIGREIARLARCLGMQVLCVDIRDHPWLIPENRYLPDELRYLPFSDDDPNIEVRQPDELNWLLAQSDFVVLSIPLTPETKDYLGEEQLKIMKPTAYLINPARGALVNEQALLKALREGWIAGAALDAFDKEPLPEDSPLYTYPNVLVTPHMAAHTDKLWERCIDVFCENLKRYLKDEPLLNQVHPQRSA